MVKVHLGAPTGGKRQIVIPPVTQEFVNNWKALSTQVGEYEDEIVARIDYIIRMVFKVFDKKDTDYWWAFYGAEEGSVGELYRGLSDDSILVEIELRSDDNTKMIIILNDGSEWSFNGSGGIFPRRWLHEDFMQELIDGKRLYEKAEAERRRKRKEKGVSAKLANKALEMAKSKLSKKELAALRRSL